MIHKHNYTATQNACKTCTPLGAALAFNGVEKTVPLLHGSQGCSTYMRRYLISHFKEPVDIASSNFTEETAIFGGGANLKLAIENITKQYSPAMIGIATTCLSETIGDDVPMMLDSMGSTFGRTILVHVSTPSYKGTHVDGFNQAVKAIVDRFNPAPSKKDNRLRKRQVINLFPGMVSNEDIRHLKEIFQDFNTKVIILPDYSERLEGPSWVEYQAIQKGGTPIEKIEKMRFSTNSLEFGAVLDQLSKKGFQSAGSLLENRFGVTCNRMGVPMGAKATDLLFKTIELMTGKPTPEKYLEQKGRLIDSYVDGNKYISQKKAVVYGEEDFVLGLSVFLAEIGIIPVLCASGGKSGFLKHLLKKSLPEHVFKQTNVFDNMDFTQMTEKARFLKPDVVIGNSKGYAMARRLKVPMVRVGFPIHDRVGGTRVLHIGYKGAQQLFDTIINVLLHHRQETSKVGYSYM